MSIANDHLSNLRTLIVRAIRDQLGLHERLAVPLAEEVLRSIQQQYGGASLYIPAASRVGRYLAIQDAYALGSSVDQICGDLGVSRTTVYRALGTTPAGTPPAAPKTYSYPPAAGYD